MGKNPHQQMGDIFIPLPYFWSMLYVSYNLLLLWLTEMIEEE